MTATMTYAVTASATTTRLRAIEYQIRYSLKSMAQIDSDYLDRIIRAIRMQFCSEVWIYAVDPLSGACDQAARLRLDWERHEALNMETPTIDLREAYYGKELAPTLEALIESFLEGRRPNHEIEVQLGDIMPKFRSNKELLDRTLSELGFRLCDAPPWAVGEVDSEDAKVLRLEEMSGALYWVKAG
ncbi:hypothetical protein IT415_01745 [bacterium]|nr:hypothetical protein [bacterium]